ncbi:hypothetical protein M8J76_005308 [Diaphorina citri]|nr:hypothetical protein M8J75_011505 [Diaphorina citri]KAI5744800.1 hypothetical protein M8J76_005308 [Diaphorina citri]KAI5750949.1 hypothetical protein M8J77_002734 [Diaphorina citri]
MAGINDERLRMMEDEMNRFEEEIGLPPLDPPPPPPSDLETPKLVIGANTFNQVQQKLKEIEGSVLNQNFGPLPPPPAPFFIPSQLQNAQRAAPASSAGASLPLPPPPPPPGINPQAMGMMPPNNMMGPGGPMMGPPGMMRPPGMGGPPGMNMNGPPGPMNMGGPPGPMNMGGPPGPMNMMGGPPGPMNMMGPPNMMGPGGPMMGPPGMGPGSMGGPGMGMPDFPDRPPERPKKKKPTVVLSATPKLYINKEDKKENTLAVPSGPELPPPMEKNQKPMSKKKAKEMADAVAASIVTQTVVQSGPSNPGQSNSQQNPGGQNLKKKDKNNKAKKIRTAGGVAWEDPTLAEWEDDDFRLFCGDLGNDVTDELLIRTFSKYPSFLKAKVVRDKRTNKTKGFGFVSFKDPQDFIRANKEMNVDFVLNNL